MEYQRGACAGDQVEKAEGICLGEDYVEVGRHMAEFDACENYRKNFKTVRYPKNPLTWMGCCVHQIRVKGEIFVW